jgi:hypothetical protein
MRWARRTCKLEKKRIKNVTEKEEECQKALCTTYPTHNHVPDSNISCDSPPWDASVETREDAIAASLERKRDIEYARRREVLRRREEELRRLVEALDTADVEGSA